MRQEQYLEKQVPSPLANSSDSVLRLIIGQGDANLFFQNKCGDQEAQVLLSLSFLIVTGRGSLLRQLSALP